MIAPRELEEYENSKDYIEKDDFLDDDCFDYPFDDEDWEDEEDYWAEELDED